MKKMPIELFLISLSRKWNMSRVVQGYHVADRFGYTFVVHRKLRCKWGTATGIIKKIWNSGWTVSEVTSGAQLRESSAATRELAVAAAMSRLDKADPVICRERVMAAHRRRAEAMLRV
jgi:hypothetical protein